MVKINQNNLLKVPKTVVLLKEFWTLSKFPVLVFATFKVVIFLTFLNKENFFHSFKLGEILVFVFFSCGIRKGSLTKFRCTAIIPDQSGVGY